MSIIFLLTILLSWGDGQCDLDAGLCTPIDFTKKRTKSETETGCFFSKSIDSNVCYTVTFPENFPMDKPSPYIVYLHGRGGNSKQFSEFCDQCGKNYKLPDCYKTGPRFPVIAVSQTKHTYWKNAPDGTIKSEDLITKDLIAHLPPVFTTASKERGLIGISMGGHGVTYLSLKNPDLFAGGFYAISPIFRSEDKLEPEDRIGFGKGRDYKDRDPRTLFKNNPSALQSLPFRIEMANDDGLYLKSKHSRDFLKLLQNIYPEHVSLNGTGGHAIPFWCGAMERSLQFFEKRL